MKSTRETTHNIFEHDSDVDFETLVNNLLLKEKLYAKAIEYSKQQSATTEANTNNISRMHFLIELLNTLQKHNKTQNVKYLIVNHYKTNQDAIQYILKSFPTISDITCKKINQLVDDITNDRATAIENLKKSYKLRQYMFGALCVLSSIMLIGSIPLLFTGNFSIAFIMPFLGIALNELASYKYDAYTTYIRELQEKTTLKSFKADHIRLC